MQKVRVTTPEWRAKLRAAKIGKVNNATLPEVRAKIAETLRGHKVSEETRAKISAALTGKKGAEKTPEWRAALSASQKGKKRGKKGPYVKTHGENLRKAHRQRRLLMSEREWKTLYKGGRRTFYESDLIEKLGNYGLVLLECPEEWKGRSTKIQIRCRCIACGGEFSANVAWARYYMKDGCRLCFPPQQQALNRERRRLEVARALKDLVKGR
jgi:hypothetical protein